MYWPNVKITSKEQKTNAIAKTRTIAHLMVTAKQVILYINVLPEPLLIQTKYT